MPRGVSVASQFYMRLNMFTSGKMVVANTLLALGLTQLSPTSISLPFKLLLFVGVDGWRVLARALISARQQEGSVFVPMHWTDQFASRARIDTLVPALTDPVSGLAVIEIRQGRARLGVLLQPRFSP